MDRRKDKVSEPILKVYPQSYDLKGEARYQKCFARLHDVYAQVARTFLFFPGLAYLRLRVRILHCTIRVLLGSVETLPSLVSG